MADAFQDSSALEIPSADLASAAEFTDDAFLGGRVVMRQPARGYRAGLDAVLLAAAAGSGGVALDVGAGVGTVGICFAARCPTASVVLVESEPGLVAYAEHNISSNGLSGRARVVAADIASALTPSQAVVLPSAAFDIVLVNPPYHDHGSGKAPRNPLKASAHAMAGHELDHWLRFAARMAAPGGRAVVIHKAEALGRLLAAFNGRFGALRVLPILPRDSEPARRILITGIKGSRAPMTVLPGFVVHGVEGGYTPEAEAILRHGAALDFG
ncbi:MAG: tRNA1(Val) (adenine(37)-N6)-methyltransferase [Hyphomicrobium sp.]